MIDTFAWLRAMGLGCVAALGVVGAAQGMAAVMATPAAAVPCRHDCPTCIPNAPNYGYFNTSWREWPTEARPDKTFPASVDREELPRSRGIPDRPLPKPEGQPDRRSNLRPEVPEPGGSLIAPPLQMPRGVIEEPAESPRRSIVPPGDGERPAANPDEKPKPEAPAAPSRDGSWWHRPAPDKTLPSQQATTPEPLRDDDLRADWNRALEPSRTQPLYRAGSSGLVREERLGADWSRALEPGHRNDVPRPRPTQPPAQALMPGTGPAPLHPAMLERPAQHQQPIRPAVHQTPPDGPQSLPAQSPVQNPVFEQPVDQRPLVAPTSWQGEPSAEKRPADARPAERAPADRQVVALDGFCPVDLGKHERWTKGDPQWSMTHQGVTYHCSGAVQRECFSVDPERYVPAFSGRDVVVLVEENRSLPGQVDFCVTYEGRLYTFSSAATLARFQKEPRRYAMPCGSR